MRNVAWGEKNGPDALANPFWPQSAVRFQPYRSRQAEHVHVLWRLFSDSLVTPRIYPSNILGIFYAPGAVSKAWICSLGKKLLSNLRGEREEKGGPGRNGGF